MTYSVLITGGAGFIGSNLAKRCVQAGHDVTIIDNLSTGKMSNIPPGAKFIWADLGRSDGVNRLPEQRFDFVYHLASHVGQEASFERPITDLSDNAEATLRLLIWARRNKIGKFIFASSVNVYGIAGPEPMSEDLPTAPKSFYAVHKCAGESYLSIFQDLGLTYTILRLFNIYGPGQGLENIKQGMVRIYLSYVAKGLPVEVKGSLDRIRDFVFIDDCVDAFFRTMSSAADNQIFNVATGKPTRVDELIQRIAYHWDGDSSGNYPIQQLPGTQNDQHFILGNYEKIQKTLGWQPTYSLDQGLGRMVDWLKSTGFSK